MKLSRFHPRILGNQLCFWASPRSNKKKLIFPQPITGQARLKSFNSLGLVLQMDLWRQGQWPLARSMEHQFTLLFSIMKTKDTARRMSIQLQPEIMRSGQIRTGIK